MSAAKEKKLPHRKQGDQLNGYQKLHNAVLEVFEAHGIGWSPQSVDTIGESYLSQVVAVLWYLDAHHETLKERGQRLPKELAHLSGFNEWKRKKIKKPQLSVEGLEDHIHNPSQFTSQSWLASPNYSLLRSMTESLNDLMYRYKEYLLQQRQ